MPLVTGSSDRAGRQGKSEDAPEREGGRKQTLLPFVAYAMLAVSAYAARAHAHEALFGVGAAALLLLFIGIHNAWDSVTYHILVRRPAQRVPEQRD